MKLSIIGTGYVGLVSGTCFAEYGNEVICVDINEKKIDSLKKGIVDIYEPNLEDLAKSNAESGRLTFTTDIRYAVESSDIIFICVGTPQGEHGRTDLQHVETVAREIGKSVNHDVIVVTKSTVPAGTTERVKEIIIDGIEKRGAAAQISVASVPEFLKEGVAVQDCLRPDRVVVGVDDPNVGVLLHRIYKPFIGKNDSYFEMDIRSAEMTKYASNAMLATRISFMNEMANLCEKLGADINKVRLGMGSDHRIGYAFIYPGVGYGGSCFPKDVGSLIWEGENASYAPRILKAVDETNKTQKTILCEKVLDRFGGNVRGKVFAVWGLSFKPNTDDIREAPSIDIIRKLLEYGARLRVYDPKAMRNVKDSVFGDNDKIYYAKDKYDAINNVEAILLVTEWKEFLSPNYDAMKATMKTPIIFDGRNQYNAELLQDLGFEHYMIGVGKVS
jgi:UDPglucose 6-dehydrogenase